MSKVVRFAKMAASGNDFIVVDNRSLLLGGDAANFAQVMCRRRFSIGADGVLLLEESGIADFKMRIFNPDGTEVEMCGNGARCITCYAAEHRIVKKRAVFETGAGIRAACLKGGLVKLKMGDPVGLKFDLALVLNGKEYKVAYINTGVPHTVMFFEKLDEVDVTGLGSTIRYHACFQPEGTNADFVKIIDEGKIQLRTYERGVEAETMACGTGATAGAIISFLKQKATKVPVAVITAGGDTLNVYFERSGDRVTNVFLEGMAELIYEGEVKWNS